MIMNMCLFEGRIFEKAVEHFGVRVGRFEVVEEVAKGFEEVEEVAEVFEEEGVAVVVREGEEEVAEAEEGVEVEGSRGA